MDIIVKRAMRIANICEDNPMYQVYCFGLRGFILELITCLTAMTIAILFNRTIEIISFLLFFSQLRKYAGGYHASTRIRCYLSSTSIIVSNCLIVTHIPELVSQILIILLGGVLLLWAPVETENKPLDDEEQKKYRQKTIQIFIIELIIYFILLYFKLEKFIWGYYMSVIWVLILTTLGKVQVVYDKHNK